MPPPPHEPSRRTVITGATSAIALPIGTQANRANGSWYPKFSARKEGKRILPGFVEILQGYRQTLFNRMVLKTLKDFFISRNGADKGWAEWIAWQLEEAGYSAVLQDWDFRPGQNFVLQMDQATQVAERTIAVLSPDYLAADFTAPEWAAAFVKDPQGRESRLITVRVRECSPDGLLQAVIYIDMVGMTEEDAQKRLLDGVKPGRAKPSTPPSFPGESSRAVPQRPRFPGALPPIWNVPHLRNRNFTGREDLLRQLRTTLASGQHAALTQAITGLGGVGKTQLALEYTYRHTGDYDLVWWMRAEEPATLASDYAQLATELALPVKDIPSQPEVIAAVRRSLGQKGGWLLVFDNAGSPEEIRPYLPQSATGHVLVTSRDPNWKEIAFAIPIVVWKREESVEFLCRRTEQTDKATAAELATELGDLPLALDQAAAYTEATAKTLGEYLALFRHVDLELMKHGRPATYRDTVTTTWRLAFEQVQATSPTGADLLRLCAFLAPDDIPKEIFIDGREWLPEPLSLAAADPLGVDQAVTVLRHYSLVNVDHGALSVHRLVQAVQRNEMTEKQRQYWVSTALRLVNELSDYYRNDMLSWLRYLRLLPHALEATDHGVKVFGPEHPYMATPLNNLAILYHKQGKYDKAEPLYQRALAIKEMVLGPDHPDVATMLNNLAGLYEDQGKYQAAKPLYQRALAINEKALGPDHPSVAATLNNLAKLYTTQGKYQSAEPLFQRALAINEKVLGPDHPSVATTLNNLAGLYKSRGKYEVAEPLFQRDLAICEKVLGPDHPDVATTLNNLAGLYGSQGKYKVAEPMHERALAIKEKALGPDHPDVATTLNNLAGMYVSQGKYKVAEPLFRRALEILLRNLGPNHPDTKTIQINYDTLLTQIRV